MSLVFLLMSSFCSRIQFRISHCISLSRLPNLLLVMTMSQSFLGFSWPWQFWRVLVFADVYQMSLKMFLFWWIWGYRFWGRSQRWSALLMPSYQGVHYGPVTSQVMLAQRLVKVASVSFLQLLLFLPILLILWKAHSPRVGISNTTSWRGVSMHNKWNSSIKQMCLFFSIYSFTQSFMSIQTHGYLLYTLSHNPMLLICFVAQIVTTMAIGHSLSWLLYPFDTAPSFYFLSISFYYNKVLPLIFYFLFQSFLHGSFTFLDYFSSL